jgi:uncharacterized protein (TIGR02271 family)
MNAKAVREGMMVRSADGEKLGKVIACEADTFIIGKGFFFPRDYLARYEDVQDVLGDELLLRHSRAELRELGGESRVGDTARTSSEKRSGAARQRRGGGAGKTEQLNVPAEEELTAEKRARQAGEVQVRKEVRTERRDLSVPVTKEEVHVERVPASGREARPGDATFREQTMSVPLREEEVEIRKRPVVKEEVRVSKTARQEERRASEDVRREDVDVERKGDVDFEREPRE